jgi:peptide/nickel transport system permease protein
MFVVAAIFAPAIAPESARATDFNALLAHPSHHHLLGTDEFGRDVFSRLVWGARSSLQVALFSTALALLAAVPLGLVAGYYRGAVDAVVARATDVLLAFPFLILAIGLAAILGPSLATATIALSVAAAPGFIRITRGATLELREQEFVAAAEAVGAGDARIVFRQVLPNLSGPLLTQTTIMIPRAIVGEATLSFLGLGMRPPGASWGVMLQDGRSYLYVAPRLAVYPGIAIAVASLAFILLGDGLRDVIDPRSG